MISEEKLQVSSFSRALIVQFRKCPQSHSNIQHVKKTWDLRPSAPEGSTFWIQIRCWQSNNNRLQHFHFLFPVSSPITTVKIKAKQQLVTGQNKRPQPTSSSFFFILIYIYIYTYGTYSGWNSYVSLFQKLKLFDQVWLIPGFLWVLPARQLQGLVFMALAPIKRKEIKTTAWFLLRIEQSKLCCNCYKCNVRMMDAAGLYCSLQSGCVLCALWCV